MLFYHSKGLMEYSRNASNSNLIEQLGIQSSTTKLYMDGQVATWIFSVLFRHSGEFWRPLELLSARMNGTQKRLHTILIWWLTETAWNLASEFKFHKSHCCFRCRWSNWIQFGRCGSFFVIWMHSLYTLDAAIECNRTGLFSATETCLRAQPGIQVNAH